MKQVGRNLAVCLLALGLGADTLFTETSAAAPSRLQLLDRNLAAVEAADRAAPRDRWDPAYVVAQVGKDPARLFAWVRANTVWIPYRGVLRGPVGVLMDGQGNSLDQSLLLATLLEKAGHTVRLAHGKLDPEQAVAVLPELVARQATAIDASGDGDTDLAFQLQATATQFTQANASAERAMAALNEAAGRVLLKLNTRVADQAKRLLKSVTKPNADDEWDKRLGTAISALSDHWWVQRRVGNTWVDMDLLAVRGDGSEALTDALETVSSKNFSTVAPHHEIVLRVIAEQWMSGALNQRTVLERVLRPADLIGQSVTLQFWPTAPLTAPQSGPAMSEFRSAALAQREWAAMLFIGRTTAGAAILTDDGVDPDAPTAGGAMSGMTGAFGGGGQTKRPSSALSAVWLEYVINAPGEEPRRIVRTVFDLVGPAARDRGAPAKFPLTDAQRLTRSRSLMMRTEILPLAGRVAPEFVTHLVAASVLGNRQLLQSVAQPKPTTPSVAAMQKAAPTVSSLYALALAQSATDDGMVFVDRPIVLTNHSYPKLENAGAVVVEATDIVSNEVGVSLTVEDGFTARVAQGVRDTNAESLVRGAGSFGNAADAFAVSSGWITLTSPDDRGVGRLRLPADVRQLILDDLKTGHVVVAPLGPVPMKPEHFAGWWRIHPVTGDTLGFGENGWGQVMVEDTSLNLRADASGRLFVRAAKRFVAGFSGMYGWCVAPLIQQNVGAQGLRFGLTAAMNDSVSECVGDSLFVGALATMPLVILTVNRSRVGRMPARPMPEADPLAKTQQDLGDTHADLGRTSTDLGRTGQDLGKTGPDLGKTGPDLGKTGPDLGETSPDLGKTKTAPDPNKTKTAPDPGKTKTADPDKTKTRPPEDPDRTKSRPPGELEKTKTRPPAEKAELPPFKEPQGPEFDRWRGRPPEGLPPEPEGRVKPTNLAEASEALAEARAKFNQAQRDALDAAGESLRYRARKPSHDWPGSDPENYNEAEDIRLREAAAKKQEDFRRAGAEVQYAKNDEIFHKWMLGK